MNSLLPPEVLFLFFNRLSTTDRVKVRRVCKSWQHLINQNPLLWQDLVLKSNNLTWDHSIIELFAQRSNHQLKRVSLRFEIPKLQQIYDAIDVLHKSAETLSSISFNANGAASIEGYSFSLLPFVFHEFSNLVDLRIGQDNFTNRIKVRLVESNADSSLIDQSDGISKDTPRRLKILCVGGIDFYHGSNQFSDVSDLLRNLSSLSVQEGKAASVWRNLLESSSKTLKHLDIYITSEDEFNDDDDDDDDEDQEIPQELIDLSFPNLQVFKLFSDSEDFPVWMKVPTSLKFLTEECLEEMPSISHLWLFFIDSSMNLNNHCPTLGTLRILTEKLHSREKSSLLDLLRKRKDLVEVGKAIDGVQMIELKQLIIPFEGLEPSELQEFRSLSKEVLDHNSKSIKGYWEVEV